MSQYILLYFNSSFDINFLCSCVCVCVCVRVCVCARRVVLVQICPIQSPTIEQLGVDEVD